jgi:hypothetical protein
MDSIKRILEDSGLEQYQIDQVISIANSNKKTIISNDNTDLENRLKMEMYNETDFRKRAAIAARIISLNLE